MKYGMTLAKWKNISRKNPMHEPVTGYSYTLTGDKRIMTFLQTQYILAYL